jgi:hypothetical protein
VYYAYFIGSALRDCNVQGSGPDLCTAGAQWIRDNRQLLISEYGNYARQTYEANRNKGVVWLLEGDFVQFYEDSQTAPLSFDELGTLARDITCAIKSNAPNAVVAMNHSAWNSNEETVDFWGAMPLDVLDMLWTTGVGNNGGYLNGDGAPGQQNHYNAATARYGELFRITGKPIFVDTRYGPSQQDDSWSTLSPGALNQHITDGVVAINVTEPPNDYQSRIDSFSSSLDSICR